jgi:hypothetical protein
MAAAPGTCRRRDRHVREQVALLLKSGIALYAASTR